MGGIDLGTQQPDDLTVDGDAPFQNELLAGPAGSHTGIGEKFLQANHKFYDLRLPIYD